MTNWTNLINVYSVEVLCFKTIRDNVLY
jgi:hypothetical protein